MIEFKNSIEINEWCEGLKAKGRTVGFVPTMGALHAGHLQLVKRSLADNQTTVVSIFVNPTQFNESSDLEQYPRTPAKDLELLASVGCDVVFLAEVGDIYPENLDTQLALDLNGLDAVMEGAKRPGHFDGVAQVVNRLLHIVHPHYLYMGQKDFQQQLIVKRMVEVLQIPTKVITIATEREADGLAMSSRNTRLSPAIRLRAILLIQTLQAAKIRLANKEDITAIESWAMTEMAQPGFEPEYFSIVNGENLQPVSQDSLPSVVVACTAVWAGQVRLIDNLILHGEL